MGRVCIVKILGYTTKESGLYLEGSRNLLKVRMNGFKYALSQDHSSWLYGGLREGQL